MTLRRAALWCVAGSALLLGGAASVVALAVHRPALVRPWVQRALTPRGRNGFPGRPGNIAHPADRCDIGTRDRGASARGRSPAPGPPANGADPRPPLPRRRMGTAHRSEGGGLRALPPPGDGSPTGRDGAHPAVRHRGLLADGRPAARGPAPGSSRGRRAAVAPGPGGKRDARISRNRCVLLSRTMEAPSSRRSFPPTGP